jgi:hypothetical protein
VKPIDVGRVVTLLANLGVIASIVFLGLELRITNDQARISVSQEMNHSLTEWQLQLMGDPAALDTYVRGLQNFDALDRSEKARFDLLMRALLERVSMAIEARESRLVRTLAERIEDRGLEGKILRHASEPGFRSWWDTADRRGLPPTVIPITDDIVKMASN